MNSPTFRQRLRDRQPLFGTFFKTPSHQLVEVLGGAGLDFIAIDAEHAPFDRGTLDVCLLAARAHQLPALVRVRDTSDASILDALDLGATGILAPHARNVQRVEAIIAASRYRTGTRGFSNSARAGNYGLVGMTQHLDDGDRDSAIVCQIEDREAVEQIDAIAAIDETDCLFIGRADLAVSFGVYDVAHPDVKAAVKVVCEAAVAAGKAIGIHIGHIREAQAYMDMGVSMFIVGSEQSVLRGAFAEMRQQFKK
jgi:2-keto-3-deoxy-L-rhamnonate aldolase RhmA